MELTIGERLDDEIKKRHITQAKLAESAGISASIISDFIAGKRELRQASIIAICKSLNVSSDWLLGLAPQNQKKTEASIRSAAKYTGLSDNALEIIHSLRETDIVYLDYLITNKPELFESLLIEVGNYLNACKRIDTIGRLLIGEDETIAKLVIALDRKNEKGEIVLSPASSIRFYLRDAVKTFEELMILEGDSNGKSGKQG